MKAFRLLAWETKPVLVDVEVPQPGPGEILIKVAGNGICQSDLYMQKMPGSVAEGLGWRLPFTLGHEIGGWVEAPGDGVKGVALGEAVALAAQPSDGTCFYCVHGHDNNCREMHTGRGFGRDGGLAPYVLAGSVREIIPLDGLDPASAGPLTEAGTTAYHSVRRVLPRLQPGATAAVIGVGGLGSFAVQYLRALSPARVVAIDLNPRRLDFARELGAQEALAGVTAGTADELRRLTRGEGVDAVLDFVGTDETIEAGIAALRRTGAFGLIGAGGGTLKAPWWRSLPMGGEIFTHQGGTLADTMDAMTLVRTGQVRNEVEHFPLARVEEAYARLAAGELRGRAVIGPNADA